MKIGLVLAGGGARGAYEIGVWKALIELGIDKYIKVVSGTSIGAMNAMLFLHGDYNTAEEIWCNITKDQILPVDEKELTLKGILFFLGAKNMGFVKKYLPNLVKGGTISRDGLDEILKKVDFNKIKTSEVTGYAACTEIPEIKPKYFNINKHTTEEIKDILYATSAIPLLYDSQIVEDITYLDGGIVDNVPVQPVYGEGCDIIIVVQLTYDSKVDRSLYPNTKIIEITYEEGTGGDLMGLLDFDINVVKKRMAMGYKDTIYKLKPIMEMARAIDRDNLNNSNRGILSNIFKKNKN